MRSNLAAAFEQQLMAAQCTQTTLASEVREADALSGWWRERHSQAQREIGLPVTGCPDKLRQLNPAHTVLQPANFPDYDLPSSHLPLTT